MTTNTTNTTELQNCEGFEQFAREHCAVVPGSVERARTFTVPAGLRFSLTHFRLLVALSHLAHLARQPGVDDATASEAGHVERTALSFVTRAARATNERTRDLCESKVRAAELSLVTTFAMMVATGAPLVAGAVRVSRIVADVYAQNDDESSLSTDFYDGVIVAATAAVVIAATDERERAARRAPLRLC